MNSLSKRKALIADKRQELKKRYGPNPVLCGSRKGVDLEEEYPENLKIKIDTKIIREILT